MNKKQGIRFAVAAAFFAACGVSGLALAVEEDEKNVDLGNNAPPKNAQELTIDGNGSATVTGRVGYLWPGSSISSDTVDFYSISVRKGDKLDVNIDGGMKSTCASDCIDTSLYILGPGPNYKLLFTNHTSLTIDSPGSISTRDAHIPLYVVPADGTYYVGVTGFPRYVEASGDGNVIVKIDNSKVRTYISGTYTLIISGATPSVQVIEMEVKPGSGELAPINPKAKGSIPVALLGSAEFDALMVDPSSLKFGRTGTEESWLRCAKEGTDVNGDGYLDLVCHFDNQIAKFEVDTTSAVLKGNVRSGGARVASGGGAIVSHADLKVRPQ